MVRPRWPFRLQATTAARHMWFVSQAHTALDIEQTLEVARVSLQETVRALGRT